MIRPRRNLFWFTLHGLPEIDQFPSSQARDEALRDLSHSIRIWEDLLAVIAITAVVVAANYGLRELAKWLFPNASPDMRVLLRICRIVLVIAFALLALRGLHRWGVRPELRERLVKAGVPICMSCGYGLRGLPPPSTTCPECGDEISEEVRAILAKLPQH